MRFIQRYFLGLLITTGAIGLIILAQSATSLTGRYYDSLPAAMFIEIWIAALSFPISWIVWIIVQRLVKPSNSNINTSLAVTLIIASATLDTVLFFRVNTGVMYYAEGQNSDLFPQYEELFLIMVISLCAALIAASYQSGAMLRVLEALVPSRRRGDVERKLQEDLGITEVGSGVSQTAQDPSSSTSSKNRGSDDSKTGDILEDLALKWSDGHAKLITNYYAQGYTQADVGFRYSLFFAIVGFAAILASSASIFINNQHSDIPAISTGTTGGISTAVSFLFFRRADKGRELMMSLVDKLRSDREKELNVLRSLDQLEKLGTGDVRLQNGLRTAATLQFLNSSITLEQLAQFLREGAPEQ